MKSLKVLKKKSTEIQGEIKRLLLDNYRYDHAIKVQLDVIATVKSLRHDLASIQREIRERLSA